MSGISVSRLRGPFAWSEADLQHRFANHVTDALRDLDSFGRPAVHLGLPIRVGTRADLDKTGNWKSPPQQHIDIVVTDPDRSAVAGRLVLLFERAPPAGRGVATIGGGTHGGAGAGIVTCAPSNAAPVWGRIADAACGFARGVAGGYAAGKAYDWSFGSPG